MQPTAARSIDQIEFDYSIDRKQLLAHGVAHVARGAVDRFSRLLGGAFALASGEAEEEHGAKQAKDGVGVVHAGRLRAPRADPSAPAIVRVRHVRCCHWVLTRVATGPLEAFSNRGGAELFAMLTRKDGNK